MRPSAVGPAHAARRMIGAIRVSLERDGMTSPENQRHAIEQKVERDGDRIVDWIEGIDQSGSSSKSAWWPTLFRAIERIEAGEADGIVVWQYSRTARHRLKWPEAIHRIEAVGGTLESATEPIDTSTAAGRFSRDMIAAHNVMQAELIGETWRETHDRRRRHGLPPTGGARFGYIVEDGQYLPDAETSPVLAEMYRRYLSGSGTAQITRYLNEAGITNTRGGHWTFQSVGKVLDSGFGAGVLSRTHRLKAGKIVTVPIWDREYAPGAHPAVISMETWRAYIAARASRTTHPAHNPERYLLTGLLRCGACGGRMHGRQTRSGGREYLCSRATQTSGVTKLAIRTHLVESVVEEWVLSLAADVTAASAAAEATRAKVVTATFTTRSLERRIERAADRIAALTIRLADGSISDNAYQAAISTIEADQADARIHLAKLAPNPVHRTTTAGLTADLVRLWPRMTAEQRAEVLRPLIDRIEILPARSTGNYRDRVRIVPRWQPDG